ncbi:MAG: hypothetical protein CME70_14655 [Halobacteriovorax sp.]|nr:hypothetical protein [Halobacteriovorax sp.]|tara:strand:- start:198734 stop:200350 length:1617 start_codon:yes stop_codon:yes gene_type:complete
MMRLSKTPFLALVSLFLLTNIVITSLIIRSAPSPKEEKPYAQIVEEYWLETNLSKQDSTIRSLYPELTKNFPQLVETHKFYSTNFKKNQVEGMESFSELTMRIFSFHQFTKRKNWQTLTRMSYQALQHYGSALQRYITEDKLDLQKVIIFNTEMKNLTRNSRLRREDQNLVFSKINAINSKLNKVEDYVGRKNSLNKIKGELANDLAKLANFSKPKSGFTTIDELTKLPPSTLKNLLVQYLVAGLIFFVMMNLYRSKKEVLFSATFDESETAMALLNKKGQFKYINNTFKEILPFNQYNFLNNLNWENFEKLSSIDFKTPIKQIKSPLITSAKFKIDDELKYFLVKLTPSHALKGYSLTLLPETEIQTFQELRDIPEFQPPESKERIHISHILEDVIADLSPLFQSKQVELSLNIKEDDLFLTGNIQSTYNAFSGFLRDLILALAPKSKSKTFDLTLDRNLDGIVLSANIMDIKLASTILKSSFKVEENGKLKKRSLNQGIEFLKNSNLGFEVDFNMKNNFDLDNKFTGSNISVEMRQ